MAAFPALAGFPSADGLLAALGDGDSASSETDIRDFVAILTAAIPAGDITRLAQRIARNCVASEIVESVAAFVHIPNMGAGGVLTAITVAAMDISVELGRSAAVEARRAKARPGRPRKQAKIADGGDGIPTTEPI